MATLPQLLTDLLYDFTPLGLIFPRDQFGQNIELFIFSGLVLLILTVDLAILIVWMERKIIARMMIRRGPTHIGPFGLMQNIADAIKLLGKEVLIPIKADKFGFLFALFLMLITSAITVMVIPWSNNFIITSPSAGLLFIFGVFSLFPIAVLVAGWASNNKYSLLGGFRSAAQLISYEIPMILSVLGVIMIINWKADFMTFSFLNIVDFQVKHDIMIAFLVPVGFLVYFVAMLAETERIPFDLPEAESELVMGYRTEYGSGPYMLIMAIEYFHAFVNSAILVLLFLGGWTPVLIPGFSSFPLVQAIYGLLDPAVWFLIKIHVVIFVMILIRAALPRVRIDQFLQIGWTRLIPLAFISLFLTIFVGEFVLPLLPTF